MRLEAPRRRAYVPIVTAPPLERIHWAADFAVAGFGACIRVRMDDALIAARFIDRLPPMVQAVASKFADSIISIAAAASIDGAAHVSYVLFADEQAFGYATTVEYLLEDLDSLLRFSLARYARSKIFIHAGAVTWKGQAVLVPGNSRSGKTSLIHALIDLGAHYMSDEHALLDSHGNAHPWPKPLSIRQAGCPRQLNIAPESLGARTETLARPVGLIVATQYRPRAKWSPRILAPGEGALALMSHAVGVRSDPVRTMQATTAAAARALSVETQRPDAGRTAARILALLDGRP